MTPERNMDELDLENTLSSATEFTGMLPAIASETDPDTLSAITDVPVPVVANREDPARRRQPGADAHPYGAHSPLTTTLPVRPAKSPGPYRPDADHNP